MEKKKISLKEIGMPRLIIMLAAGILLILLTFPGLIGGDEENKEKLGNYSMNNENHTNTTSYDSNTYISELEGRLESILRKVKGIGEVEVMITLKTSGEKIPLKDVPYTQESLNEDDGEGGSRESNRIQKDESTVLVTNDDGNTEPYILQEKEPEVEGILVIAEGGDNVLVQKDIMEACEVLFNIPMHKVKVMKMSDGIK